MKRDGRIETGALTALTSVLMLFGAGCAAGPAPQVSSPAADGTPATPSRPPSYKPSMPGFTVKAPNGLPVNKCVPKELRAGTVSLRTSDGVPLSAIAMGGGPNGVVLSHEQGYNVCSWLALGKTLADGGYNVVVVEYRNHGASGRSRDNDHLDRDAKAAIAEVTRRGATRIVLGGASCGGTASIVAGRKLPTLAGLIVMSSPRVCGSKLNGLRDVKQIRQPSFFAFSPGDHGDPGFEPEVRGLFKASGAADKHLEIPPGGAHGTDMLREKDGAGLTAKLVAFVKRAFA
ncbi:alpha/beta hydrolase [Nonomuraea sp. NPDC050790]|uniref:alpha/beta hydrolase n=1 Tax=Nonomuraea sp. NPDC050790 TaxID=3364371 RepID=UPI0037B466AA